MTINQVRRLLFKTNVFLGDVNAIKRGKIKQRLENRAIGRLNSKVMRKAWRR